MKNIVRILVSSCGLTLALPGVGAAETAPAPAENHLRVLVDRETPAPGAKRRVIVQKGEKSPREVVAFLGVQTAPVSRTLTTQLGLPDGSGLVITHIVPESAAAAVLQEDDILLKLDDQILIATRQLEVLVRNHKEGDEVALSYLRAGKPATAKVKLGKHEVLKMTGVFTLPLWDSSMAHPFGLGAAKSQPGTPPPEGDRAEVDHLLSLLHSNNGEPVQIEINANSGSGFRSMSVHPGNSSIAFSDDAGSLDLTIKDGKKSLVAKNAKGEQLFSGPVTTPDERKAMPADVRERLEKLEGMHNMTFRTDGDFRGAETRVFRPEATGISLRAAAPVARPATPFF